MSATEKVVAPSILDLINKTCELPTLPDVLVKLNEVMSNPESSADDVAAVISLDPPVATNILRIVNSAYYGLQVRVSSVNLAVSIMGFKMTKKVALKAAVFSQFARKEAPPVSHFDPATFWKHSIFTGVLARGLAQASTTLAGAHPEDVYICGLLHDIGTIILLDSAPESLAKAFEAAETEGTPVAEIEERMFGYTHADVGSVLAIKWFLPEELTIAIRYHEAPEKDPFQNTLSPIIALADRLAAQRGKASSPGLTVHEPTEQLYESAGIDPDTVEEIVSKAEEEFAASGTPW